MKSPPFSLTPALSRWEREPRHPRLDNPRTSANPRDCRTILPLPAGEGRGEGERPRRARIATIPARSLSRFLALPLSLLLLLTACSPAKTPEPPKPAAPALTAQELFDRTTKEFHLPSAEASGPRRDELLARAAAGYEQLLREHSAQTNLCAQSLRSLANIRVTQGRLDDALKLYAEVAARFPGEEWEVLQAWKSASDALATAQRDAEARAFDQQILTRFDRTNAPPVVQIIVRGARARLAAPAVK